MRPETADRLTTLNKAFYEAQAGSFAATRRRIQPGIRRALAAIPTDGRWLDLGCGSGALGLEWAQQGRTGEYLGLDASQGLLDEARRSTQSLDTPGLQVHFFQADLCSREWSAGLVAGGWDGGLCFAVLHHIPGEELRRDLLRETRRLLKTGGRFYLSVWQFQNSPRLMERVQTWEAAGLTAADVDPGDHLLDWRAGDVKEQRLRYVHIFSSSELSRLAAESGFSVMEEWQSDGEGGKLGLYQVWQAG
jgi:SAM-dependent methyltransferase